MGYRWMFTYRHGCRIFFPEGICAGIRCPLVYRMRVGFLDIGANFKRKGAKVNRKRIWNKVLYAVFEILCFVWLILISLENGKKIHNSLFTIVKRWVRAGMCREGE
jgi:hypothetical protein